MNKIALFHQIGIPNYFSNSYIQYSQTRLQVHKWANV